MDIATPALPALHVLGVRYLRTIPPAFDGPGLAMSSVAAKLRNSAKYLRRYGAAGFCKELHLRLVNGYYERYLGIETETRVRLSDIGITKPDSRDSMPIGYTAFYTALKRLPIEPSTSTFLDFGVGRGRAVCAAATLPFRRIIGVEISNTLVDAALTNLGRMRHRKTDRVELIQVDAAEFSIPADVNLIYFFNPFAGSTLRSVVDRIALSYRHQPRKVHLVFFNNDHFDTIVDGQTWIRKTFQTTFYPMLSLGLYETTGAQPA